MGSTAAQQLSRRVPVEVISDPLNDVDSDPYEDGADAQKQLRGHQVFMIYNCKLCNIYFVLCSS